MYRETVLTAPEMHPAQQALEFVLQQQKPAPALGMDRQWNLLRSNQGANRVFRLFLDPAYLQAASPPNIMRLTFDPHGLRPCIVNWDEVAGRMLHRLHREAGTGDTRRGHHAPLGNR